MLVTHEPDIAEYATRIVAFRDGRVRARSAGREPPPRRGRARRAATRRSTRTRGHRVGGTHSCHSGSRSGSPCSALRRNAMRTALTALGMIIGVAAVIVMVAIGTGARTLDREPDPAAPAPTSSRSTPAPAVRPGPRQGRARPPRSPSTTPRRSAREVAGHPLPVARAEHARADHRRARQLEHAGAGHRAPSCRRSARGRCSTARSSPTQDVARAAKVAVLGSVARDQLFGAGADPDRRDDPHQEPAVPGRRRADAARDRRRCGPGSGRHRRHPLHDGAEALLGVQHVNEHHHLGGRRRRRSTAMTARHRRPAADAPPASQRGAGRRLLGADAWRRWRRC